MKITNLCDRLSILRKHVNHQIVCFTVTNCIIYTNLSFLGVCGGNTCPGKDSEAALL